MIRIYLFLLLSVFTSHGFAQGRIQGTNYTHFQLKSKKDTIDFVIADTNFTAKKPLLLFCQGSLPVPLFVQYDEQTIFPTAFSNFDLTEMNKHYYVAVISMPSTPVVAHLNHLNRSYNYILDPTQEYSYDPDFIRADYLQNYVDRATKVLNYLGKQAWIKTNQLVVAGHSQGSHIALELASKNPRITQLGLFGFNPLGRVDQYIRMLRKQAETGQITWHEADSLQETVLEDYASYFSADKSNEETFQQSWVSFSKSQVTLLSELKTPVYIAYGSHDINSDFCDLMPLYFIEHGKTNYKLMRYGNLEHNFFPLLENGQPDYDHGQWIPVMNAFLKWTTDMGSTNTPK